jgi:hypothetical protein
MIFVVSPAHLWIVVLSLGFYVPRNEMLALLCCVALRCVQCIEGFVYSNAIPIYLNRNAFALHSLD